MISQLFANACRQAGLAGRSLVLSTAAFRRPGTEFRQGWLFPDSPED